MSVSCPFHVHLIVLKAASFVRRTAPVVPWVSRGTKVGGVTTGVTSRMYSGLLFTGLRLLYLNSFYGGVLFPGRSYL